MFGILGIFVFWYTRYYVVCIFSTYILKFAIIYLFHDTRTYMDNYTITDYAHESWLL